MLVCSIVCFQGVLATANELALTFFGFKILYFELEREFAAFEFVAIDWILITEDIMLLVWYNYFSELKRNWVTDLSLIIFLLPFTVSFLRQYFCPYPIKLANVVPTKFH